MSAYDNPSIIRNEAAQIWGQAAGDIAESFTKSFAQAKETREAKEKELRLTNERKEKESNQLIIEQQRVKQGYDNKNQEIVNSSVITGLPKDDSLMKTIQETWGSQLNKVGEDNTLISTTIQSKKFKDDALDFSKKVELGRTTVISTLGASTNQVNTYSAMTADATRNIVWSGNDGLDQLGNMTTCNALNPNNYALRGKVVKDFLPDPTDPSKNKLKVTTEIGDRNALKEKLKVFYVGQSSAELDKVIEDGIKNNKIVQSGDNYKLNFEQEIGQGTWDGTFYKTIPELTTENLFSDNGAKLMDSRTQRLNEDYLTQPSMRGLGKKVEGQVQYIKMNEVLKMSKPYYLAEATGLLEGPLADNTVLRGYLSNRVDGGEVNINKWMEEFNTVELRRNKLADLIMQKDINTKFGNEYKSMDATKKEKDDGLADNRGKVWMRTISTQEVKPKETTTPGSTKTAAELKREEEWAVINRGVSNKETGGAGNWDYDGRKVSYDGKRFRIEVPGSNQYKSFDTKGEVLQYLKEGSYNK